ncbi:hypothetical protein WA158_004077 [Blastocystis sp. Blastoise]
MLYFFTKAPYKTFPKEWLDYFENLDINDILKFDELMHNSEKVPKSLKEFYCQLEGQSLHELIPYDDNSETIKLDYDEQRGFKVKKIHEVTHLCPFIHKKCEEYGITHIVDIGAGQAYLPQILSSRYCLHCVGIESKQHNVDQTIERIKTSKQTLQGSLSMICCSMFLTDSIDNFEHIAFGPSISPFSDKVIPCTAETSNMMIGLHACGDLSCTVLRLFANPQCHFQSVVLVTCCYGLLSEQDSFHNTNNLKEDNLHKLSTININNNNDNNKQDNINSNIDIDTVPHVIVPQCSECPQVFGYPMSRHVHLKLGHFSRNLMAQNVENITDSTYVHLCFKKYLYRALMQVIFVEKFPQFTDPLKSPVGTIPKAKTESFVEYARYVLTKFKCLDQVTEEYLQSIYDRYKPLHIVLACFWILQCKLAPLLESVVHIDRVFFLLENGIHSEIYNVFNRNISPRSLVIVAHKTK